MPTVQVDFSKVTGRIKPMHGVNNAPFESPQSFLGTMKGFKEAGFPYVRNHDGSECCFYFGERTNDVMFIFPDFDADENDPANYDFYYTDCYVKDTYSAGSSMYFRLGSKIECGEKKYNTIPPKDYAKYARICEHIMAHYLDGWADGYHFDIQYWEIWNEADGYFPDGTNYCWQGSFEEFLKFYEIMAKHLKASFPACKIGGPAFTHSSEVPGARSYMKEFVEYMASHEVPMDFCSWHGYITDPAQNTKSAEYTRKLLDANGYTSTEAHMTEWNYVCGWVRDEMIKSYHTMMNDKGAAFDAAAMLAAQKSPMDVYVYYDARPDCSYNGIFAPYTFEYLKGFYAFWQFNKLYRLNNEVFSNSDDTRVYVGAAKENEQAAIQLAYYENVDELEETAVTVEMKGLPVNATVRCYVTDKDNDNKCVWSMNSECTNATVSVPLKSFSTVLLTVNE